MKDFVDKYYSMENPVDDVVYVSCVDWCLSNTGKVNVFITYLEMSSE